MKNIILLAAVPLIMGGCVDRKVRACKIDKFTKAIFFQNNDLSPCEPPLAKPPCDGDDFPCEWGDHG